MQSRLRIFWHPISHNRRGEGGRGCAISRTCFSHFAHVLLAFCSRGARVMLAWYSFLVPPTVVPFYRPGVFERVFWGILGAGVFVVLGEGVFVLFSEGGFLLFSGK